MANTKAKPSIESMGLRSYLDGRTEIQNGFGYDMFIFLKSPKIRASNNLIGRIYNVKSKTVLKWSGILKKEQSREG